MHRHNTASVYAYAVAWDRNAFLGFERNLYFVAIAIYDMHVCNSLFIAFLPGYVLFAINLKFETGLTVQFFK